MGYLIEKQILRGFAYHPMNEVDRWEQKDDKLSLEDAKIQTTEYANNEKGTWRVRDIYSGKVLFRIES